MFKVMTLAALMISGAAMADVELRGLVPRPMTTCSIKGNEVTKVITFGKDKIVKSTEKYQITFEGVEAAARTAAKFASNAAPASEVENFHMILDGKRIELDTDESVEALALVQMIVKACRY
ncbi:hypothetical protein ACJVC5_10235 [Peredibacter sp. HCB2-198]|uniref:hypothetical protein n=1 Tax=Peredibacter sp. HCB2-198 TaxID=3383025 RepID=UPI0038B5E597